MTISSTTRRAGPYTANGIQTDFPFAFKVFQTSEIVVTQTVAGVDSVLAIGYTVTLNLDQDANPGGVVSFAVAPTAGYLETITSNVAATQSMQLTNGGAFYPTALTVAFDRLTILVQQLAERLGRTFSIAVSDSSGVQLPTAAERAGKLLGFDAGGNAMAFGVQIGTSIVDLAAPTGAALVGAVGGTVQDYLDDGYRIINVDHPPYNGNLLNAYNSISSSGNVVLKLGKRSYSLFGIGANIKPNVAFIGEGMPLYDSVNKRLVDGSGTVLQGQLYNQAKGINVFNLGIDYGDWVRVNLASGQYNDVFSNTNCGENAGIKYGDIVVLASDVVVGTPASNTHCILNQTGTGFRQSGVVEVIGGYHGHVIKVFDFIGATTISRYQVADGVIIKTDAPSSAGKVSIDTIIIDGDATKASAGVLLEAQSQTLSSVSIGKIVATNATFVLAEGAATNSPIVDVSIGEIYGGNISGAGGATQAVAIGAHVVGFKIGQHELNACVNGGLSVATGAANVDIGSGYSKSSTTGDGYKFDAQARHGRISAIENAGWGVRNNSNTQINAADVFCNANTLGGISTLTPVAITLQNSWVDSGGTFRVVRYGSEIGISGQLTGGAIGALGAWVTVALLDTCYPVMDEFIACTGFQSSGSTKALIAKVTSSGQIQVYGMGDQAIAGFSLSGRYCVQGNQV